MTISTEDLTARANQLAASVAASQLPPPPKRKRIREDAGVSLREAARAIGVAPTSLSDWEDGVRAPRRENAMKYRALLDALQTVLP